MLRRPSRFSFWTHFSFCKAARTVSLLSMLFLMASCGWQLRGYQQYKEFGEQRIAEVHLRTTAGNREFQAVLKRQLADLSIELKPTAKAKLVLHEETMERRPLSYGSTGIPVQYQLIMSIRFEHSLPDNTRLTEKTFIARRQYDFDTALVVAKSEEERVLLEEMRNELSTRIIASLRE